MTAIERLVERIKSRRGCNIYPSINAQSNSNSPNLPADLVEFYNSYERINVAPNSDYPLFISAISELIPSNEAIIDEDIQDDITAHWRILAKGRANEYISIDLSPDRLGFCYDSFADRHGIAGSCPIIAKSFTEFLERTLNQSGARHFWLERHFASYGDAYD